jgi:seryl-tRNA synthetase
VLQQSQFLDSFPQLAGTVFSFGGSDAQHRELSTRIHDDKPWGDLQVMTDVCLTPAACYPVYPTFTGTLPENGRLVDMQNWVFRHEPSEEPTRMMAFRIREFVRVGSPDLVIAWRDLWLKRGLDILTSLGLPATAEVASDPFFGRGGRMLAANQRDQKLKFEVVVPVISKEKPTALCSFNYHQDKFGSLFNIKTATGDTAETACLGFGLERIVMALFKTHGMIPSDWPKTVREVLWA